LKREHNPSLIEQLENDHQKLFGIYHEISNLFQEEHNKNNHAKIQEELKNLKSLLIIHLKFENALLYSYLNDKYEYKKDKLLFIKDANNEMQDIATVALEFIVDCSNFEVYSKNQDRFKSELERIGKFLVKRIKFEETRLYPLYR